MAVALCLGGGLPGLPARQETKSDPVAIIVNKQNALGDLSLKDLKAIFRADRRSWSKDAGELSGKDVSLVLRSSDSPEQKLVLDKVYGMTAEQLERYWVEVIYQGRLSSSPTTKASAGQAVRAVSRDPAAISFVLLKDVTGDVKVLSVEGKAPGAEKYPLFNE